MIVAYGYGMGPSGGAVVAYGYGRGMSTLLPPGGRSRGEGLGRVRHAGDEHLERLRDEDESLLFLLGMIVASGRLH